MSSGAFSRTKYQADNGDIYAIRVQPETLAANFGSANAAPAGAVDRQGRAKARGSSRELGIKARKIRVVFTGSVPDGYATNTVLEIPILTPAVYNAIIPDVTTGTYLGSPALVIGKTGESVK